MADGRRTRSDMTREALLSAGARLFSTHGYEGSSVQAIAEEAGVNKALVSYHFGGKKGLYSELFLTAIRTAQSEFVGLRTSTEPADQKLQQYVEILYRIFVQHPYFPFIVLREEMSGGVNFEPEVFREFAGFFLLDREILEEGMEKGIFRRVDTHMAHLSLVGSIVFFLVTQPFRERSEEFAKFPVESPGLDEYFKHVTQMVLRGLAR